MSLKEKLKKGLTRAVAALTILVGASVLMVAGTVQYTSRSDFCRSCHIMEPYYQSWKHSVHNFVDCVDCHYEPGLLETAEGKFKALSQLAKYVTGTQGTKPWAEISDQSCMRSGCHSERLLSGPIQFGRIRFDHRHHLLETRRGRELRCTSCHSQIVQGEHMRVTTSTCFLCHFRSSGQTEAHSDCLMCHGPPKEDLQVAGRTFRHTDYTDRGVACGMCHRDAIRGAGLARKNRCNSCHGEEEHISRFNDVPFIHENHVTLHKVECNECHDEIEHGLSDRAHVTVSGDCAQCHQMGHDTQAMVYAGRGAAGVPDMPSRMYQTRVDCGACHRDFWTRLGLESGAPAKLAASDVSCMYCHETRFGRLLETWQAEVKGALTPIQEALSGLESAKVPAETAAPLRTARSNLDLIRKDGSFGVHNISYALAMLRAARDGVNSVGSKVDPAFKPLAMDIGVPATLETTCATACHVDVARKDVRFAGVVFKHRPHLVGAGLDCNACHSEETHGQTTATPEDCKQCHHGKSKPECISCHDRQAGLLRGTLAIEGATLDLKHPMSKLSCMDCHQSLDGKDVAATVKKACIECHSASYGEMLDQWREATAEEVKESAARLQAAKSRVAAAREKGSLPPEAEKLLDQAQRCFDAATQGVPVHNVNGAESLLGAAGQFLDGLEALLGK